MDEETNISEVISLVGEAQKRGKFSLADAIKGRSLPEKSVDIYTDEVSAHALYELNKTMDKAALDADIEKYGILQDEAIELAERVSKSKLTFNMIGLSQVVVDEIGDTVKGENTEDLSWSKNYICSLIAASIKSVEDAEGNIDDSKITLEDATNLYMNLPRESWARLVEAVEQLTLATGIFKGITDAGFLQKS